MCHACGVAVVVAVCTGSEHSPSLASHGTSHCPHVCAHPHRRTQRNHLQYARPAQHHLPYCSHLRFTGGRAACWRRHRQTSCSIHGLPAGCPSSRALAAASDRPADAAAHAQAVCCLTVSLSDVVNELHNKHSLADTSTAEQTNLATTLVGGQQVHDLRCRARALGEQPGLHGGYCV